jgi:hypothetical protein
MRPDLSRVQRALLTLHADQVPFAAALALTALAKDVAQAESLEVDQTFDSPTQFTEQAFAVRSATKRNLVAFVSVKKIAATYLRPYVEGGERSLISRKGVKKGMIVPKNIGLDAHGPDIFVGKIKGKDGALVSGVWQRAAQGPMQVPRPKGMKRGQVRQPKGGLKLLIRFEDTTEAPKHFEFFERARAVVQRNAQPQFTAAMRKALASARR